jgi:hypothetical protein
MIRIKTIEQQEAALERAEKLKRERNRRWTKKHRESERQRAMKRRMTTKAKDGCSKTD